MLKSEDKKKPTEKVKTAHSHRNMPMLKNSEATTPADKREYKETILLFIKMLVTIFLCEATIMVLMYIIPLSRDWEIIAAPLLLTALATLILFWLFVRPIWLALQQRNRDVESLRKSEDQLSTFMASATDGFILFDSELNHIEMNESALEIAGLERKDVIGKNLLDVVPGLKETERYDEYKKVIKTGVPFLVSDFVPPAKFSNKHIELKAFKVGDGLGMIVSDITEHKKAEEALLIKQNETEALLSATRSIPEKKTFSEAARGILVAAKGLLGADSGYVALLSEDSRQNEVLFLDAGNRQCTVDPNLPMPIRGLRAEAYGKVAVLWENDFPLSKWEEFLPDGHVKLDNVLFASIMIDGKAVGTIGLANKPGGFGEHDAEMAKAFSDIAAVGLRFARDQEKLSQSEEKFRKLTETIDDVFWITSLGEFEKIEYVSDAFRKIWGREPEELYNDSRLWTEAIHPDDRRGIVQSFEGLIRGDNDYDVEYRILRDDGSIRWIWDRGFRTFDNANQVIRIMGLAQDITESKKVEKALRKSENLYRTLVEANPYGIQEIDTSGIITYTNPAYQKKLGYTEQELLGKSILDLLESESKRDKLKDYLSVLAKEQPQPTTYYQNNRTKDNRIIDMAIDWNYKRDNEGRVIGFTSVITDITDRKKAEQQILENQAQLKSLASQLSITEERERRRIATELHDQIGQSLVFSKIKLDELHQSASSSQLTKALDEICNNIGQIIQDTRSLTFDLSSPILNEFGLEAAVADWLEVQIGAKHGIETEFEDDGRQKPLDDDIQALLFRNVRELLINIVKHANAKNAKVYIRRVKKHIHIDVEDDGKGFNTVKVISGATKETKFGLFSIKERLEQLGGHFEIDSEPGRGSKFTMTAPLKLT